MSRGKQRSKTKKITPSAEVNQREFKTMGAHQGVI